jgi:GNAT superfamily N-acetyltransferase
MVCFRTRLKCNIKEAAFRKFEKPIKKKIKNNGYGRALLVELAKIARDRDCGRMEWAVLDWNEPAIKFYRALGAKPMDEWTVFRLTHDELASLANSE